MVAGIEEQYAVLRIEALQPRRLDGEAEAVELLKQAAWQVQPIMKRRQWKVLLLKELEPENMTRGGDNTNRGEVVRIKVRRPGGGHYDFDHVLAVMLHELCHNEFGPHSASFYKLLDDITEECAQLQAKKQGGTGSGFDASGQKLGHRGGWGIAPCDPKAAAREAALKRAEHHAIMGGGGRLGGAAAPSQQTPQQAAADAALRRSRAQQFTRDNGLEDDALGTRGREDDDGQGAVASAAIRQAPQASGPLQLDRRRCICGACGPGPGQRCGGAAKHVGTGSADSPIEVLDDDDDDPPAAAQQPPGAPWLLCVACGSLACSSCWACKLCTRVNVASSSRCDTCDTWRFAHA